MLQKKNRLRATTEFQRAFRGGRRVQGQGLFLKTRASEREESRIGIIVSKKVAKKATERNRLRRILAAALRTYIGKIQAGQDIVVVALPMCSIQSTQEAEKALEYLFRKASLLV